MTRNRRGRREQLLGVALFGAFVVLWIGFGYALVASQDSLGATWDWIRGLPPLAQLVVCVAFLPVVAGLWVWHTDVMLVVRVVVIAGIAFANLYTFLPRSRLGLKA